MFLADDEETRRRHVAVGVLRLQGDLRADHQVGLRELVECGIGYPVIGIVDRHHAAIRLILAHLAEDIRHVAEEEITHAGAKFALRRLVRVASRRAETRDGDVLFQRERGRHDLAVDGADRLGPQRPLALLDETAQHLVLALGRVNGQAFTVLDRTDFFGHLGALVEEAHEFRVDGVDLVTQAGEVVHHF